MPQKKQANKISIPSWSCSSTCHLSMFYPPSSSLFYSAISLSGPILMLNRTWQFSNFKFYCHVHKYTMKCLSCKRFLNNAVINISSSIKESKVEQKDMRVSSRGSANTILTMCRDTGEVGVDGPNPYILFITPLGPSFLPSRNSIPGGVRGRPYKWSDSSHPGHRLFSLLPHGKRYRSAKSRSKRLLNSFPQAIRLLNI